MGDIFLLPRLREGFALNSPEEAREFDSMTSVQAEGIGRRREKRKREGKEGGRKKNQKLWYHCINYSVTKDIMVNDYVFEAFTI